MDNTLEQIASGEEAAAPPPQRLVEFLLPVVIVGVDQATKAMVRASVPMHDSVTIIPGFLDITHALNSGAAFGILNGADFPFKTVIIAVIAAAALIGVGMYAASLSHHQLIARVGLALIIGGAAGNLIDRIGRGSVTDFIKLPHWPAFNVADIAVTAGVIVLVFVLERK
jgi:signal peptidase II